MVKFKQQQKQLEAKDAEKAKAEQVAYNASKTKTTQSLTTQLQDVAQAFCLEVQGQALTSTKVSTELEVRAPNKVYYPPVLHLDPSPTQPEANPSSASTSVQLTTTPTATPAIEKGQDQPPLADVVEVESEKVAEVGQLKWGS